MKKFFKAIYSISAYAKDELLLIFKDKAILLILVIANIIYPLIYSFVYQGEQVKELPTAIVDLDNTQSSRTMLRMIDATEGLHVNFNVNNLDEAQKLFYESKVNAVILIPEGFEKNIYSGIQTTLSLYADAGYFLYYKQAYASIVASYRTYSAGIQLKKGMAKGVNYKKALQSISPVSIRDVQLYNPSSSYGSFIMPSVILVILQQTLLIGIGMVGGTRKELMKYNFIVTNAKNNSKLIAFLSGKSIAYFIVFLFLGMFTLVWIPDWFGFPNKTDFLSVLLLYIPFILSNIFLGLSVSVLFKHRENAMIFMVFLSIPVLFLSGASWPAEAIPGYLNKFAAIFPSTHMVPAYQKLRTSGIDIAYLSKEFYTMLTQIAIYSVLSFFSFKYILKRVIKKIPGTC